MRAARADVLVPIVVCVHRRQKPRKQRSPPCGAVASVARWHARGLAAPVDPCGAACRQSYLELRHAIARNLRDDSVSPIERGGVWSVGGRASPWAAALLPAGLDAARVMATRLRVARPRALRSLTIRAAIAGAG